MQSVASVCAFFSLWSDRELLLYSYYQGHNRVPVLGFVFRLKELALPIVIIIIIVVAVKW